MKKLVAVLILGLILGNGCKKSTNDPVWERSYGTGTAYFIRATADSGLISCGELAGKPYLIKLDKNKNTVSDYTSSVNGLYSSLWFDTEKTIAAGTTDGKILITCLDSHSTLLWDTTFSADYYMDFTSVCYLGNGNLMAVGSASPDSTVSTGISFVWFNTSGIIQDRKEIPDPSFIAARAVAADNSGNIYLALTRKVSGSKTRASVAKYNDQFQKIWETELYNNPNYAAACLGISLDNSGNIYVAGVTELADIDGPADNTFAVSLTVNGIVQWRSYLENINGGSGILTGDAGNIVILNYNCFIVSVLTPDTGLLTYTIRTFDVCDSKDTDAFGRDLDINYDGNLIMAGSKGGGYYLNMKPPESPQPM
jgi:hypothetical protein